MDGSAFDRLALELVAAATRRRFLAVLAGLPFAGLLTSLVDEEGAARRKRHGRRARHRPGKHKDNRRGKRKGSANDRFDACVSLLTARGCTGVTRTGGGSCPPQTDLRGADLHGCILQNTNFERNVFSNPDGTQAANFTSANLTSAYFGEAQMTGVNLTQANMYLTQLPGARLDGANLNKANLKQAYLLQAYMPEVTIDGEAYAAIFTEAYLFHVRFDGASLQGANFQNANLSNAYWYNVTCPDGSAFPGQGSCCGHLNGYTTPNCD